MADNDNTGAGPSAVAYLTRCPMCGAAIAAGIRKCAGCGEIVPAPSAPKQNRLFGCFTWLTILGIGAVVVFFMLPAYRRAPEAARRSQCKNNLKMIGIALHNYENDYGTFPPAYTVDADGKPLHSWRTLILPYLDQHGLYNSIDLAKPWNDPINAAAFAGSKVREYSCPSDRLPPNHTTYLANAARHGCFRNREPLKISQISDGMSDTLMVIEVPLDWSVLWMSPQDADEALILSIGADSKLPHTGGSHVLLCDGAIRFLSNGTPAATRRALISVAGGEKIGDF
jgi:hypothetical protein